MRQNRRAGLRRGLAGWLIVFWLMMAGSVLAESAMRPIPWPAPAPPFHLRDLAGDFRHLSDFRGRVVVVNFWASWCSPCRQELPSMNRAWSQLQDEKIVMLAINVGEDREAVTAFLEDFPIDFPVLLDSYGNISQRWRVRGLPTTFVLNTRGESVYEIVGERQWDDEAIMQQIRDLNVQERLHDRPFSTSLKSK
ncbi:MAG: TlpA family protein disulfide reductase [Candidatus Thiodiazotropha sp. (ex Monitilora ramsayi)]|nr:TlpA family protein disulfide reductase [Candidatus Thiodiazotropha sp. (ex Monitilora ramsayi)]